MMNEELTRHFLPGLSGRGGRLGIILLAFRNGFSGFRASWALLLSAAVDQSHVNAHQVRELPTMNIIKTLKKLSFKLRWVPPLAACGWWAGLYANEMWHLLRHFV